MRVNRAIRGARKRFCCHFCIVFHDLTCCNAFARRMHLFRKRCWCCSGRPARCRSGDHGPDNLLYVRTRSNALEYITDVCGIAAPRCANLQRRWEKCTCPPPPATQPPPLSGRMAAPAGCWLGAHFSKDCFKIASKSSLSSSLRAGMGACSSIRRLLMCMQGCDGRANARRRWRGVRPHLPVQSG